MGGRGAASGMSSRGKPYGSEYDTVATFDNIKFVKYNDGAATAPLETMTAGRIYVTVDNTGSSLKSITFYDSQNKRFKQIDLDHYHKINGKAEKPHTQTGYYHNGVAYIPTKSEQKIIDYVYRLWHNKLSK